MGVGFRKTLAFLPKDVSVDEEDFEARADMHRLVGGAVASKVMSARVCTDTARTRDSTLFRSVFPKRLLFTSSALVVLFICGEIEKDKMQCLYAPRHSRSMVTGNVLWGNSNKRLIKSHPPSALPDEVRL